MITTTDFFFDTLCLAINTSDPEDKLLMREVLDIYAAHEDKYKQDKVGTFYLDIVKEILRDTYDLSVAGDVSTLLLKFNHNPVVIQNVNILEGLKSIIKDKDKTTDARINALKKKVQNWILWAKSDEETRKMFGKLQRIPMRADLGEQEVLLSEVAGHARKITDIFTTGVYQGAGKDDALDFIDMSNKESVLKAVKTRAYAKNTKNVFKLGLQGLSKLFFPYNGPTRGESVAVIASSHHYKSGMLMSFARWIATLNPIPPTTGKPAIVFISLENEIYENLNQWFRDAYTNAFHAEPTGLTDDEIVDYVTKMYSQCGYNLLVYRRLGDLFGINEYIALIETLETEGYTIVASIIDYITLMKVNTDNQVNSAKALQQLASTMFNYNKHRMITTITGLQLDGTADKLNDSGRSYVVKQYGTSHLADCKGLLRELDFAAFMYIETNHLGFKYLTMAWKKHRYVPSIPREYNYPAFPFTKYGILDDVDKEDSTVYDIYTVDDAKDKQDDKNDDLFSDD